MHIKRAFTLQQEQQFISGFSQHVGKTTLTVANHKLSTADILKLFQGRVDARTSVNTAKAAYSEAILAEAAKLAETQDMALKVMQAVKLMFASSPTILSDLGLVPTRARREPSSEERMLATQRARATREARHTMGKKQRLAIKGELPEVTTPAAAPVTTGVAAPSPSATPAAPVPSTSTSTSTSEVPAAAVNPAVNAA